MALVLSGSIDISGSMTATTIVVSSPGAAGMVSSSAQITELAPLMAYTASIKGAAIVSSSQQITNYYKFAETASANTFYNTSSFLGITGMGTSTPLSLLHIASGDTDQGLRLTRANGTFGFRFTRTGNIQGTLADGITFQTAIELSEGNSSANNYLRLQPTAGTVGIGPLNISPDTKLHISGSDGIKIQAGGNADTPGLTIINYTNQYGWAKFAGGLQGNGNGYATISCWNGASVSEKVRVSGDGYLRLAETGIQFNGDTADANSLDDYEEGFHTATIDPVTSGTVTLNTGYDVLSYVKIGSIVHVSGLLSISSVSSPVGSFRISLPFQCANLNDASGTTAANIVVNGTDTINIPNFVGWVDELYSYIAVYRADGLSVANTSAQQLKANTDIYLQVTYRAS